MSKLDPYLLAAVDAFHNYWPRARPTAEQLQAARIISHRGERPHRDIIENTLTAFDPLVGHVWALECDIRFSRDGVAMVFHDADLLRIFSCRERLCDLDSHELRLRFPQIPTLKELVQRYAGKLHFMLEFKAEHRPDPQAQLNTVREALNPIQAQTDFHLMALDIPTLTWLGQVWPQACVPIARHNVAQLGAYAIAANCAGMAGHYALLRRPAISHHVSNGQWCGLGFPATRQCLRYCLNQGATHLFSNHALALQSDLDREKSSTNA
ncbi:MAG: glycerophosphodiester phosphodiesterase [Oceanococcus sp.]